MEMHLLDEKSDVTAESTSEGDRLEIRIGHYFWITLTRAQAIRLREVLVKMYPHRVDCSSEIVFPTAKEEM
jgi:hypothetical protein